VGCGQGQDAQRLPDKDRAFWRQQAHDWLREDLVWWGKVSDKGALTKALVRKTLRHWQSNEDLAGVRGKDALARLPVKERKQWKRLWSDVDALLRRARLAEQVPAPQP
jgi:hypothetical protein